VHELCFRCLGARPEPFAAGPSLELRIAVRDEPGRDVGAIALRCQLRVEPQRRGYSQAEAGRLHDLFGPRERWSEALHPFSLAHLTAMVPAFRLESEFNLAVPLSYDLEVAAGKYFASLEDGAIPLRLLFSGTIFTGIGQRLVIEPIPWSAEASFDLPAGTWRATMDAHFPGGGWIRLRSETIARLRQAVAETPVLGVDELIDRLLCLHTALGEQSLGELSARRS
jgi:hypothetical protein